MFDLNNPKNSTTKRGFTLIEMMVSVSIFVIVAFIVVSTLLTMSYAYKKAQKMRLLMDNLNFSIQSLSLNLREGINYNQDGCGDGSCIQFEPLDSWLSGGSQTFCYSSNTRPSDGTKGLVKCSGVAVSCPCPDGSGSDLVSPEIDIKNLKFNVSPSASRKIQILINGTAGVNREYTDFFIQNTVSQRNIDQ